MGRRDWGAVLFLGIGSCDAFRVFLRSWLDVIITSSTPHLAHPRVTSVATVPETVWT